MRKHLDRFLLIFKILVEPVESWQANLPRILVTTGRDNQSQFAFGVM